MHPSARWEVEGSRQERPGERRRIALNVLNRSLESTVLRPSSDATDDRDFSPPYTIFQAATEQLGRSEQVYRENESRKAKPQRELKVKEDIKNIFSKFLKGSCRLSFDFLVATARWIYGIVSRQTVRRSTLCSFGYSFFLFCLPSETLFISTTEASTERRWILTGKVSLAFLYFSRARVSNVSEVWVFFSELLHIIPEQQRVRRTKQWIIQ